MLSINYSADPLSDDGEGPDPWADDYLQALSDHDSEDDSDSWDDQQAEDESAKGVEEDLNITPDEPAPPPLRPLQKRLIPSQMMIVRILSCLDQRSPSAEEGFGRAWLWRQGRLVCSSWRTWIEKRAREQWLIEASMCKDGPMIYDDYEGKVWISANFDFVRCDGDIAVFKDNVCPDRWLKKVHRFVWEDVYRLDCCLGGAVHDLRIPGTKRAKEGGLIVTVPWKAFIGHVLQEEALAESLQRRARRDYCAWIVRVRTSVDKKDSRAFESEQLTMTRYTESLVKGYNERRRARMGRKDRKGDRRTNRARSEQQQFLNEQARNRRRQARLKAKAQKEAAISKMLP